MFSLYLASLQIKIFFQLKKQKITRITYINQHNFFKKICRLPIFFISKGS